jgi:anaerobic sulfite reductase subunit A
MKMLTTDREEAEEIFSNILKDYTVLAPTRVSGKGRFSDSDLVTYGEVASLSEICFESKTYFSFKSILFPIRESMFCCDQNRSTESKHESPPTVLFLRACDIHALEALDAMFQHNGNVVDTYYAERRRSIRIFLLECANSFDNCFCVSLKTNRTDEYSAFVREQADGYAFRVRDSEFASYFPDGREVTVEPRFVEENRHAPLIPESIDTSLFKDDMWKEYSKRCIACGRCNTSCPTCSCFSVQNVGDPNGTGKSKRMRIWSSCQVDHFSRLAGNHEFRKSNGDRMRYKVLHKIVDFKARFGFPMCVGCGRCEDVCPEYISMVRCVETINRMGENRDS